MSVFNRAHISVLVAILALASGARAQDNQNQSAGGLLALTREGRQALSQCDLIRARVLYEQAERVRVRQGAGNVLDRALGADVAALGDNLLAFEKKVETVQLQLGDLISRRRWEEAGALLDSRVSQVCSNYYQTYRDIVRNGRNPERAGAGFSSRFGSGVKISAIVGGSAAAGLIALDKFHKY